MAELPIAPEIATQTQSIVARLAAVVDARSNSPALLFEDEVWSFARLWETALGVASPLSTPSSKPGQKRIGVLGTNHPEYIAGYLGVLCSGSVAVPLNHLLRSEELAAQVVFADLDCCLVGHVGAEQRQAVAEHCRVLRFSDLPARSTFQLPVISPDDDAMILLTSGTTGTPKGVVHSHKTLAHATNGMQAALPFASNDITAAFLPFFASIPEQILPELLAGGTIDVLPKFDPEAVARACLRCTSFDAVPTIASRLLDHGDFGALNRLRWVMFASEVMPPSVLQWWWHEVAHAQTFQFYGLTELLTVTHADHELLKLEPTTIGVPFDTSAVAVVDDAGRVLTPGVDGEIVCSSPAQMTGYFRDPEATARVLTPIGAIRTGDQGHIDDAGRLYLTGRLKDIIISGGLNVSPAEIEAVAVSYPGVAAAAVVGVPDERWGETPIVVVVPKRGATISANAVLSYCRSRLSGYKRPSGAAVIDELPTTGIGKAAKRELRNAILERQITVERAH